jgi:hypothetical protein
MRHFRRASLAAAAFSTAVLFAGTPWPAISQEVELVVVDPKAAAKGYSAKGLMGETVMNDQREPIGTIDDIVVAGSDDRTATYAVLEVGDFLGLGGHLVAVPFTSLELDERSDRIVLAGATREALRKLPVYVSTS